MESGRQKKRDGSNRTKTGENTHQGPNQDPKKTEYQVAGIQSNLKP
jgi:hypothetical protein